MTDAAFEFKSFTYTYPGAGEPALRAIDLAAAAGEFVLVCGDSGSGKSTLLQAMAGIVPHHYGGVVGGEARICGRDLRLHNAASLAEVCAAALQDPESQVVMGGVEAELAFALENAGWKRERITRAIAETTSALGIGRLAGRRTAELSGGELQRVVLAASLVLGPRLLVLDEPTSQLDPAAAGELVALLRQFNRDAGGTVVVADHRIERLLGHADRVVVLDRGAIAFDGEPQAMLSWAAARGQAHRLPQAARMFSAAGRTPLPVDARAARRALAGTGDLPLRARPVPPPAAAGSSEPPSGGRTVASIADLGYCYRDAAGQALAGIDLTITAGERIALIGANGSGKSTLLRLVKGLIEPSCGAVSVAGGVGLLLQNPNDYLLHERVAQEAPVEARERFGLGGLDERDPRDLSGGQRQRLALAIVMQERPALLLLDEPSRGMDHLRRGELLEQLEIVSAAGTAVVVATHDTELAAEFADRVVLIDRGRIVADATPAAVLDGQSGFTTDVARVLPGRGVLTAAAGAALLRRGETVPVHDYAGQGAVA